jgi:hypothetical protein
MVNLNEYVRKNASHASLLLLAALCHF